MTVENNQEANETVENNQGAENAGSTPTIDYKAKYEAEKKAAAKHRKEARDASKSVQNISGALLSAGFDPDTDDIHDFVKSKFGAQKKADTPETVDSGDDAAPVNTPEMAALLKQLKNQERAQKKMAKELEDERALRQKTQKRADKSQIDSDLRSVFVDQNGAPKYDCNVDLRCEVLEHRAFVEDGVTMIRSKTDPNDYEPLTDLVDDITSGLSLISKQTPGAGSGGQQRAKPTMTHAERLKAERAVTSKSNNSNRLY